MKRKFN